MMFNSMSTDIHQDVQFRRLLVTRQFRHYLEHTNWMAAAAIAVALAGGAFRGLALYYNYGAPINTWMHVREDMAQQKDVWI